MPAQGREQATNLLAVVKDKRAEVTTALRRKRDPVVHW